MCRSSKRPSAAEPESPTQADIARREAITRAQVAQVLSMLRLAPEIPTDQRFEEVLRDH